MNASPSPAVSSSPTTASSSGTGTNNSNATLTNQQYGQQLAAKSVDQAVAFVAKVIADNRNHFAVQYQSATSGGLQLPSITDPNGSLLSLAKYQQSASSTTTSLQSATKLLSLFT